MKKARLIIYSFLSLSLILLGIGLYSGCVARKVIYPGPMPFDTDVSYNKVYTKHYVSTKTEDDTTLRGWLLDRGKNAPLVVVYGGNSMNVGGMLDIASEDSKRSYLLMNYRGYGASEGSPSQEKLISDALHNIEWAKKKLGAPKSVHLLGFSIGAGVAMQVGAKGGVDSMVLICPFDSLTETAANMVGSMAKGFVRNDAYDSVAIAPDVESRVTIIAGKHDNIVKPAQTENLIKAFKKTTPTVHWMDSGHNDIFGTKGFYELIEKGL